MLKDRSKLAFKMKDLLTSLTGKVESYRYSHVLKWYSHFFCNFYVFQLSLPFKSYRKVFGQMCVLTYLHTAVVIQDSMASHHIPRCSYMICVLLFICDWI